MDRNIIWVTKLIESSYSMHVHVQDTFICPNIKKRLSLHISIANESINHKQIYIEFMHVPYYEQLSV